MTGGTRQTILVTGGAGYVGSHSVLLLLNQNYSVIVIDNVVDETTNGLDTNGNVTEEGKLLPESLRRVEELANRRLTAFYRLDLVNDKDSLDNVFRQNNIRAVIHFAALKSVSESINLPLEYYTNNLIGTINLLNVMKRHGCRELIFSSSATVYGLPQYLPVDEKHQVGLNVLNPYGRTKCMIEQLLKDLCTKPGAATVASAKQSNDCDSKPSDSIATSSLAWNIISLRYFNPVGAHPSGYIGEYTRNVPNNLMPYISQVSIGKRERLLVYGNDFDTIDGTGVRDYIHIIDLANGHIHALDYLLKEESCQRKKTNMGYKVFNLGTGKGYSVLEVIKTFEQTNGVKIPYEITSRREGDAGEVYADAKLALQELGWSAKYTLVDMCRDTYRWQTTYPEGFKNQASNNKESSKHESIIRRLD